MKRMLSILALIALILSGCASENAPVPELLTPVGSLMDTVVAEKGVIEDVEVYEAAIIPEHVELCFTHDALIGNIPVMLGGEVKKGDVLVEMDTSSVDNSIAALKTEREDITAAAEYAKAIYDIDMEIFALELKKLSGDEAYDKQTDIAIYELEYQNAAEARNDRLSAIDAELSALEESLKNTAIVSPCDGRVTYVAAAQGSVVKAYETVCVVTDDDSLSLKSEFISPAALSSAVEMYAVINGERLDIAPMQLNEDEYSRAMLMQVEYLTSFSALLPDGMRPGDTCVVYLVTKRLENVLRAPVNSVFSEDDEYYVYRMDGGSRIKTSVTVGETNNIYIEITSGIEEGDEIYVGD